MGTRTFSRKGTCPLFQHRHCEEPEATKQSSLSCARLDCFAPLAPTFGQAANFKSLIASEFITWPPTRLVA
jgi:hypothetical protein